MLLIGGGKRWVVEVVSCWLVVVVAMVAVMTVRDA